MKKTILLILPIALSIVILLEYQFINVIKDEIVYNKTLKNKKLAKEERIYEAWMLEFEKTKDPTLGYVPRERLKEAYKYAEEKRTTFLNKKGFNSTQTAITDVSWVEEGPNNVGGRTRALMWDPNDVSGNKVWAGGVSGGLWYNNDITDPNSSWIKAGDQWDNIAITSIAYDPNTTTIFYFGTGEGRAASGSGYGVTGTRGEGIWKSTNSGTSWTQLSATSTYYFVNDLIVRNESGTSVIYAGVEANNYFGVWTDDEGLYRSTDGGANFTQVLPALTSGTYAVADIELGADNKIYVGSVNSSFGHGHATILYSDNGTTWTANTTYSSLASVGRVELATSADDANIVYAMVTDGSKLGAVGYSSDKGVTWTATGTINEPNATDTSIPDTDFTREQGSYDLILTADPNDATIVYAGGIDLYRGVYSSSNITWTQISKWSNNNDMAALSASIVHADQHQIVFKPGSSTEAVFGNDGGVFYSSNFSSSPPTITAHNNDYNTVQYYATAMHPTAATYHFLAGAQDNGSHRMDQITNKNGVEVSGGDGGYTHIDQNEPAYQFTSYIYNDYYRSTDNGINFTNITFGSNKGYFINPTDYDNTANIFYASTDAGNYLRWSNPQTGTTFSDIAVTEFGGGNVSNIRVSENTANRVFFGLSNGRVVRVDDANGTHSASHINSGAGMPTGFVSCVEVEVGDDAHILVTYSNYGVNSIWETTDGGTNWASVEGDMPDMPIRWILFNPNNSDQAMAATELGVWTTDNLNGGTTDWGPSITGLANTRVDMLQTRSSDDLVAAATHGRGLFTSDVFSTATAQFAAERTTWFQYRPLSFVDASLKATSWSWTFGDAGTSTSQNPSYTYNTAGDYNVALSINSGATTETKSNYLKILVEPVMPYTNDFESNDGGFYSYGVPAGNEHYWAWGSSTSTNFNGADDQAVNGTKSWTTNLTSHHGFNTKYALESPPFNFVGGTGTYTLSFNYMSIAGTGAGFNVEYSTDGGSGWTVLGSVGDANATNWYTNASIAGLGGDPGIDVPGFYQSSFTTFSPTYDVSAFIGQGDVRFRFVFGAQGSANDGVMIDDFTINGNAVSPLPVEINSFIAHLKDNKVILNWETSIEINNYGFEIQRIIENSETSPIWEKIGFVEGHGNSNSIKNYSFVDNSAEGGIVKYRLKQIDTDGSFEYSDEIEMNFSKLYKFALEQNYPNPFNPTTKLNYTIKNNSKVVIEVYNTLGQKVVELYSGTQNSGKHSVSWNATGFSSGTYFARFSATSLSNNETFSEVKKLLLIK